MTEDEFAIQSWENEGGTLDLGDCSEIDSNTVATLDETPQTSTGRG